ncbi:MAG: hypothetical protein J4G10_03225 [Alphaproteobacteria bacterium]|nr:hypothetical protein [Alphaproteobacteria bacterium]
MTTKDGDVHRRVLELAYSHKEIFRAVPKFFEPLPVKIEGTRLVADNGEKKITLDLAPEKTRKLGASIKMQDTEITFTFHGYTEEDVDVFMKYFVLRTQRGGG